LRSPSGNDGQISLFEAIVVGRQSNWSGGDAVKVQRLGQLDQAKVAADDGLASESLLPGVDVGVQGRHTGHDLDVLGGEGSGAVGGRDDDVLIQDGSSSLRIVRDDLQADLVRELADGGRLPVDDPGGPGRGYS